MTNMVSFCAALPFLGDALLTMHSTGEAEATMLLSFIRACKFRRWFQRPDCPPVLISIKSFFDKAFGSGNFNAAIPTGTDDDVGRSSTDDLVWVRAEDPEDKKSRASSRRQPLPEELESLLKGREACKAQEVAHYKHDGVFFTRNSTHVGNSLIRYYRRDGRPNFGSIKYIYKVKERVTFIVQRCLPAERPDPFLGYPDFPAVTRSPSFAPDLDLIEPRGVICHVVRWAMPSGDVALLPLDKVRAAAHFVR